MIEGTQEFQKEKLDFISEDQIIDEEPPTQITKKLKGNTENIDIIEETPPETQENIGNVSKIPKPKKPATAYFWFLKEYKKQNLVSSSQSSMIKNIKDASEIWNSMTPDEKKIYVDMAAQDKERYKTEMENYRTIVPEGESSDEDKQGDSIKFPIHKIKNLMKSDEEVNKIRKPVYELVTKVTEAFGEYLLQEIIKNMKNENRKRLNPNDLITVSKRVSNLRFLDEAKIFKIEEGSKEKKSSTASKPIAEKKKIINTTKNHKISDFFIKKNN